MKRWARYVLGRKEQSESVALTSTPRVLAFDFDGTIADTFHDAHEILNKLAVDFGFRQLSSEELDHARDMRTRQLMRYLGIPMRKMSRMAKQGSQELSSRIQNVKPLPGMRELLLELKNRGFVLGLITSNTQENVGIFLKNYDLEIFDFIRCSSKLMGKSREIRSVLKSLQIPANEFLFIGDETRDIDASQKAGIPVVAVTWGYNSRKALESVKPSFLVDRPEQIMELIEDPTGFAAAAKA